MIELLFALSLAGAAPVAFGLAGQALGWGAERRSSLPTVVALVLVAPAILALALPRGPVPVALVVPWLVVTAGLAIRGLLAFVRHLLDERREIDPWRIGLTAAVVFLAVGATWAAIDRAGLQPFGFGPTIVLLTAVHFHVAGFVLTLAGTLAARERPGPLPPVALALLVAGTPLTALGFFGLPIVSWIGALLVATGGMGIGVATLRIGRDATDPIGRSALLVGGATLFVTMPLAAAYATGTTFGIAFLDIPAMAAIHGGLNVIGFAIPTMTGWRRLVP